MIIMGVKQHPTLQAVFDKTIIKQAPKNISDSTHIPHPEYQLLPLGRHFRAPEYRLNCFKNSFVPLSIKALKGKSARALPL